MPRTPAQLRDDALAIWHAGLSGVRSEQLIRDAVHVDGEVLLVGDEELGLSDFDRILVVGGGKAGAGMAAGLLEVLGPKISREKQLTGWLNVPADCVRELPSHGGPGIKLHAARPAGVNEPTPEGVVGSERILELVHAADTRTLCLVLLSGGASALLPAPCSGITLADKLAVTRFLSGVGANIAELNTVRKHLSRIKGGNLARASNAGRMITLVLSDVLGDPLDLIGSGPTVPDTSNAADALAILKKYGGVANGIPQAVFDVIEERSCQLHSTTLNNQRPTTIHVIGNNATAVDCAGIEAEKRGYSHAMIAARELEGSVEEIGRHLARIALRMRDHNGPDCLIMGGEGIVSLAPAKIRGRGGRNQQTILAALDELSKQGEPSAHGIVILSGGTDGEDGPTDAAGAWLDEAAAKLATEQKLDLMDALQRNAAYDFFESTHSLLKTGPTHTNVCDLRVVVVARQESVNR
jgi:glycerate 2-kinase